MRPARRRGVLAAALLALTTLALALPVHGARERVPQGPSALPLPVVTTDAAQARVIVKFKADSPMMRALSAGTVAAPPQHAQALSARLGIALTDGRRIGVRAQVLKASGIGSADLAQRLAAQPDVEYAVVDERKRALAAPNDPLYPAGSSASPVVGQWYLRAPTGTTISDATTIVSAINSQAAWDVTNGSPSVAVAVLDTGVRLDHPDLAGKLRPGYDFIADIPTALDADTRDADPSDPGDSGCTAGEFSSWHGTQVAGLVGAATNNGVGMAGSGRDVMVLPVRVLGKCGGFDSDIQAAMLWAAGIGANPAANPFPAKVVNLSLGSTGACSAAYADVIGQLNRAGVVVVAAAGNDGLIVGTPANCAGVIAVAGVRHAGTKVGYSDLGQAIAISAPAGNCVNLTGECLFPLLTTSNRGTTTPTAGAAGAIYTSGGGDASIGTSFSAPLVSGTVGLMFSANPTLTPTQALAHIQATARPFPASGADVGIAACSAPNGTAQDSECYCTTSTCGAGLLDAGAATAAAARVTANIGVASTSVAPGASVALDGSGSRVALPVGAVITAYQWAITSGAGLAGFTSATNASTATLAANAVGSVVVSLTVTDSSGAQATSSVTLTVAMPPPEASSGGGGGAMQAGWLFGWLAAVLGVWVVTPRGRSRPPA